MEKKIIKYLTKEFLKRVKERRHLAITYWWKWVSTVKIAKEFNITCAEARKILTKMEQNNLIHHHKYSGFLVWAPNHIEGYKQHQFKDYFEKA